MNPEQQRIAIAEACGWRRGESTWWVKPINDSRPFKACSVNQLPDFLNDLNAMHDAEKVLTEDQQEQYLNNLYEVCNLHSMINDAWNLNCATAAQRAEAFLRTIGKWEESK